MKLKILILIFMSSLILSTSCMNNSFSDNKIYQNAKKIAGGLYKLCDLPTAFAVGMPVVSYYLKQTFANLSVLGSQCLNSLSSIEREKLCDPGSRFEAITKLCKISASVGNTCTNIRDIGSNESSFFNSMFYASTISAAAWLIYLVNKKWTIVDRESFIGFRDTR